MSSAARYRALAPAKINLGLFVGPTRAGDGRHELVTVMQSISLADELTLEQAPPEASADELVCPGVPGAPEENLAARALGAFRAATGWEAPPLRLSVRKRIPVAAGMGGGSADAAATLRLARHASGLGDEQLLYELAVSLGADVPAQVSPGRWLATGAGEQLQALPDPLPSLELLVLPSAAQLSTADVYTEADQLGLTREADELEHARAQLARALERGAPCRRLESCCATTCSRPRCRCCPEIGGGAFGDRRRRRRAGARVRLRPDRARPVRSRRCRRACSASAARTVRSRSAAAGRQLGRRGVRGRGGAVTARPCVTITAWHATK